MVDRLDEEAVQRVVRRAIELDGTHDPADGIDPAALVAAASELGIAPDAINLALAIERLGPEPESARIDRVVGPRAVIVERTVSYGGAEAFDRLDEWFTSGHHLRREFRDGAVGEWRKRGDLVAGMQRRARSVAGGAALGSIRLIVARVSEIDSQRAIIRLSADRAVVRRTSAGTVGVTGAGALAAAVVATAPVAAVVVPGLAVAGAVSAAAKHGSTKLERELVRLLDQIESGRRPATLGRGLKRRLGAAVDRP